jgi:dTDP-4-dehydrorhamnose reductase
MRVVITGYNGQLGRQLRVVFSEHEILELDLPCDDVSHPAIRSCIADFRPDLVLHAAAFTNVDGCEQVPEQAYRVNVLGTQYVALGALQAGAAMLYVSTNEVFDGSAREPYREWDPPNPISVYARTKMAGEQIVRQLLPRSYVVRVAWLFGPEGDNFVTKILAGARKHGALRVAADEFGNPTYAPELAAVIRELVGTGYYGTYHLTNSGFCSRYDFAREIMRLAGRADVPITPILNADWSRPSRPPLHALLANTAGTALGVSLRPWQEALAEYMTWLKAEQLTHMELDDGNQGAEHP